LRATFISAVVRSGATVKEAQAVARHATPDLTFRVYAHVQRHDLSRVLANMPASTSADPANAQKARKTGTDAADAKTDPPQNPPHSQHREAPIGSAPCRSESAGDVETGAPKSTAIAELNRGVPLSAARMNGAPGRNRTCNRRIRNPMLYPVELRALLRSFGVRFCQRADAVSTGEPGPGRPAFVNSRVSRIR
jgi:hypothetical protein